MAQEVLWSIIISFEMLDYSHNYRKPKDKNEQANQPSLLYDLVNQIYYYKCLLIIGNWRALGYMFSHHAARALMFW
jgi:hypothetical protein